VRSVVLHRTTIFFGADFTVSVLFGVSHPFGRGLENMDLVFMVRGLF
jgi:hypothetical protein